MGLRRLLHMFGSLLFVWAHIQAQEVNGFRIINITFNTSSPTQLATNRGRLIWRDTDINTGNFFLRYFSGAEIVKLDSNVLGVTASIDGDFVVWNTSSEQIKVYNVRTWITSMLGPSYNPDFGQQVSVSNGIAAYARRKAGNGTNIMVHRFASGTDTVFSAGTWNTSPSVQHGQLAWVAGDSEAVAASSNIFFYDGLRTRNISNTSGMRNRSPILRDAQLAWLQSTAASARVKLFTGDSVVTIGQPPNSSTIVVGYDLSDGIAVAGLTDSVTGKSTIKILNSETGSTTTLNDTNRVSSLHIDNGLVIWQSGTGPGKRLKSYTIQSGITQDIAAAENPVVDDDRIAWTLGDAVELRMPVTYQQMTTDGMNGWEQTKFKTIDSGKVVWGNYANSTRMRLFYSNGVSTTRLTDSSVYKDLVMANDGFVIWRLNFDSLYYFDGSNPPVKFLDTVQSENPYLAGGSVGFFGSRTTVTENIKHAWLYRIGPGTLTQLTTDSSDAWNVLCYGNTACWLNRTTGRLMYYDGSTKSVLSDSATGYDYSYRSGKIVWTERLNGIWQVFLYDVGGKTKAQLSNSATSLSYPITDGAHVVWYEDAPAPVLWYYDIATGRSIKVAHTAYSNLYWNWMSEGKIAWVKSGNVFVFDGSVVVRLTDDDFNINSGAYLDRGMLVWRRTPNPPANNNGQIFRGKLRPHAAFDAVNIVGPIPLAVSFFDRSWEGNQRRSWDFGDGGSSTEVNPIHSYLASGTYTVTLSVTGPTGSVVEKKIHLVRVSSSTSVDGTDVNGPTAFALYQNFPNPFNPSTKIRFGIGNVGFVSLKVYDILGREVATLVNKNFTPGMYEATFDGSRFAGGVYFYRLEAGSFRETKKLVLLR